MKMWIFYATNSVSTKIVVGSCISSARPAGSSRVAEKPCSKKSRDVYCNSIFRVNNGKKDGKEKKKRRNALSTAGAVPRNSTPDDEFPPETYNFAPTGF